MKRRRVVQSEPMSWRTEHKNHGRIVRMSVYRRFTGALVQCNHCSFEQLIEDRGSKRAKAAKALDEHVKRSNHQTVREWDRGQDLYNALTDLNEKQIRIFFESLIQLFLPPPPPESLPSEGKKK